jgi:hypothetical protein
MPGDRAGPGGGREGHAMTLWSDFLRRLMVTATLSGPAVAAAEAPTAVPAEPPAEIGEPSPTQAAAASERLSQG